MYVFSRRAALAAWVALAAAPALAGVVELDQTCAVEDGCFPGDAPGFPIQIAEPGSYRLTGNLEVPDENTTAIEITAHDVSLDLAGWTIVGVNTCAGYPTVCDRSGAGKGVDGAGSQGAWVHDGSVHGMGSFGIHLGRGALVTDVRAWHNGGSGLRLADHAVASRCLTQRNDGAGIRTDRHSSVSESQAHGSVGDGVSSFDGSSLSGLVVSQSGRGAFASGSVVAASVATENLHTGITARRGALVRSVASRNGVSGFGDNGASSALAELTAWSNGSFGLQLGDSGVGGANVSANGSAATTGGLDLGGNLCDGSTSCP